MERFITQLVIKHVQTVKQTVKFVLDRRIEIVLNVMRVSLFLIMVQIFLALIHVL